jgi:hypothetical protein
VTITRARHSKVQGGSFLSATITSIAVDYSETNGTGAGQILIVLGDGTQLTISPIVGGSPADIFFQSSFVTVLSVASAVSSNVDIVADATGVIQSVTLPAKPQP